MMDPSLPRVALLTNAPAPYRTEFFAELAKRCQLLVVFDTELEPDRQWLLDRETFAFDWLVSRGAMIPWPRLPGRVANRRVLQLPLNTFSILRAFDPEIVVSDELGLRTVWALVFAQRTHRHLIVWWEGTPQTDGHGLLRALRRSYMLSHASRVWGNGVQTFQSLLNYGVNPDVIDLGMTGMSTVSWKQAVDDPRFHQREQVRQELHLQGAVLLFVGRLDPIKGVAQMFAALEILLEIPEVPAWSVLCVGSGPAEPDIDRWAKSHPEVVIVRTGFVQEDQLPQLLRRCRHFCLAFLGGSLGSCLHGSAHRWPTAGYLPNGGGCPRPCGSQDIGDVIDPRDSPVFARSLADRIAAAPALVPEEVRAHTVTAWSPVAAANRGIASIRAATLDDFDLHNLKASPKAHPSRGAASSTSLSATITVSIDDGHPSDRRAAELLAELGYKATFYIPERNPERAVMGHEDIRAIAGDFEVGAHTVNHVALTTIDRRAAFREIAESKTWLEDVTSTQVRSFCYPRGKFDSELAQMVQDIGFVGARTTMGNLVSKPLDPYRAGATTQAFSHCRVVQFRHAVLENNWRGIWNYGGSSFGDGVD